LHGAILAAGVLAAGGVGDSAWGANRFWDGGDASAANNNAATGAGLGGPGGWDNLASANWWDGVSAADQAWNSANNDTAIFWGPTPANISLNSAVTASLLDFRTSGYGIIGAQELTLNGLATVNVVGGANATVSSIIVGSSGLTKTGAGVLLQNNINNTYTGGTFVNRGVLAITAESITPGDKAQLGIVPSDNLTPGSGLTLNGTTLRIDPHFNPGPPAPATFGPTRRIDLGAAGGTFDVGADLTLVLGAEGGGSLPSGGVYTSAGGRLTKTGPGRVAVGKSTANAPHNFVGLTVRQGTWAIFQTDTVGNPVGAQPPANPASAAAARAYALVLDYNGAGGGATLQFRGYGFGGVPRTDITLGNNRPILIGPGGGTIDTNGSATSHGGTGGVANTGAYSGILSLGPAGTGTLTKTGDGEFYHYGDANYGGLRVTRGSWAIDNETQLGGTASPYNVTLDNGADAAPGAQPATLRIVRPNVTLLAAHTLSIGPGGGTVCVDNSATWNGPLLGGGTLTKGGYIGNVASPLIGNSAGAGTLVLTSDSPGFTGNVIVNAGSLIAANPAGSATGSGAVSIAAGATLGGTGAVAGRVTNAGVIAPGEPGAAGRLTVGRLDQDPAGRLSIDLANDSTFDRLAVVADAALDGTFQTARAAGFVPEWGTRFGVMTFASRSGTFDTRQTPGADAAHAFVPVYSATDLTLEYSRRGDANLDERVDVADLGILATHFNTTPAGETSWLFGDFSGDGFVDVSDLGLLATHFNATAAAAAGPSLTFDQAVALPQFAALAAAVPEPGGLWLLLALAAPPGRRRRRAGGGTGKQDRSKLAAILRN
jgi:fibronectin-binding autotransporter adhesin